MKNGMKRFGVGLVAALFLASSTTSFAQNTTSAVKSCKTELFNMHGNNAEYDRLTTERYLSDIHKILATKWAFDRDCGKQAGCDAIPAGVTPSSPEYGTALTLLAKSWHARAEFSGSRSVDYFCACLARHLVSELKPRRPHQPPRD